MNTIYFPSKAFGMSKSTSFTNYIPALLKISAIESTSAAGSSLVANVSGGKSWFRTLGVESMLEFSWQAEPVALPDSQPIIYGGLVG